MKKAMLITILALSASIAQAKVVCNVNTSTANNNEYDQIIYSGEVKTSLILIVDAAKKTATPVELSELNSLDKWQGVNGKSMVSFSRQDKPNYYGITEGKIDLSKKENILPITAMTLGTIGGEGQVVALTIPSKDLSMVCFELKD